MFTRQQYLNHECSHIDYYSQFVTPGIKDAVIRTFGIDELKEAYKTDEHFNNIPLYKWDNLGNMINNGNITKLNRELGDYTTLSGLVCIVKEAARQVVNEE